MSELSHMEYNLFDKVVSYNEVTKFVKKKMSEMTWKAEPMIMAMNKMLVKKVIKKILQMMMVCKLTYLVIN